MVRHATQYRRGFTLVELLVVVAIIGILMSMLFPAINAIRTSTRASVCRSNLRQLALAVRGYTEQKDGRLPAQWRSANPERWRNFSWTVSILPMLEEQNIQDSLKLDEEPFSLHNRRLVALSVPVFECPAAGSPRKITDMGIGDPNYASLEAGARDYVAIHSVTAPNGIQLLAGAWNGQINFSDFHTRENQELDNFAVPADNSNTFDPQLRTIRSNLSKIADGLSSTALLVEQAGKPEFYDALRSSRNKISEGAWATAEMNAFHGDGLNVNNYTDPYSFHNTVNVAFCDGSVHAWDSDIDPRVMRALLSRRGGEIIDANDWQ